ncbi:hypothetical protein ABZ943_42090, partial [Streptomyces rubiginosohelvolus]
MTERTTFLRSAHDLGLAAWFGGALMGAVGLNGAAEEEGVTEVGTARIASALPGSPSARADDPVRLSRDGQITDRVGAL